MGKAASRWVFAYVSFFFVQFFNSDPTLSRPSPGLLSSSPTVLGLLQRGDAMHAGQERSPGAGEAALTSALRDFSISAGSSVDPFAKTLVTDVTPRSAAVGGLAAALQQPRGVTVGSGAASVMAPKPAAPVLLSASFRDRPAFLAPVTISEEEHHDAALDSSDDEAAGGSKRATVPAAGGRAGARAESVLSEEDDDDDDDGKGDRGMRDEAAEELQL